MPHLPRQRHREELGAGHHGLHGAELHGLLFPRKMPDVRRKWERISAKNRRPVGWPGTFCGGSGVWNGQTHRILSKFSEKFLDFLQENWLQFVWERRIIKSANKHDFPIGKSPFWEPKRVVVFLRFSRCPWFEGLHGVSWGNGREAATPSRRIFCRAAVRLTFPLLPV